MRPEEALLVPFIVALGAIVGSFANVCIHRLPRGESVVAPRSRCPRCGAQIRARDNVPVASWLLLGGKCRDCAAPIPVRYPLVEAAVATLFFASFWRHGLGPVHPGRVLSRDLRLRPEHWGDSGSDLPAAHV